MTSSVKTLKLIRQIHLYLGVFISPALLFFAITGALQTFSLHETTQGSDYKPPVWIVKLGQLHKKQTTTLPIRRPRPEAPRPAADKPAQPATPPPVQKSHLPMKLFFLLVSIGLALSTFTGIYMSYKYTRAPKTITALLLAGILIPLVLTLT
jgi:hypothetical protein